MLLCDISLWWKRAKRYLCLLCPSCLCQSFSEQLKIKLLPKTFHFDVWTFYLCVLFLCFTGCSIYSLMKMPFSPDLPYETTFWGNSSHRPSYCSQRKMNFLLSLSFSFTKLYAVILCNFFVFIYILRMFCIFWYFNICIFVLLKKKNYEKLCERFEGKQFGNQ